MKLVVCVDDQYGLLFNNRRVSRDVAATNKILNLCNNGKLWIHPYSAALFPDGVKLQIDECFLEKAQSGDWCFLENADISQCIRNVEELVILRWNRKYPSDFVFPFEACFSGWTLVFREDFPGNSHDTITMEVYCP